MLAAGGNAFDAAVAVSAALAVVEPTSSGLGGGGFYLLHRQSDGFETMLDAREKAPGAATRDMYLDAGGQSDRASFGGRAAGGGNSGRARGLRLPGAALRQIGAEGKPAAGDSPGARGLSAVSAPAGRHSLQARTAAALARCGQGVSDRRGRGAGARHHDQAARLGAHSRGPRSARRQGLLRRPRGAGSGERRARRRRHLDARGPRRLSGDRAQAAGRELSRRTHRVRLAALIGRRRVAGCAQYSGGLRSKRRSIRPPANT